MRISAACWPRSRPPRSSSCWTCAAPGAWPPGRPRCWRERRHRSPESAHWAGHDCCHRRRQDGDRGRRGVRRQPWSTTGRPWRRRRVPAIPQQPGAWTVGAGDVHEALQEYRKISQIPLASVEQALAHWAQGEMRQAADAELEALKMLGDAGLSTRFYNRRAWLFRLPNKGIRLSSVEDKRCYALLGSRVPTAGG